MSLTLDQLSFAQISRISWLYREAQRERDFIKNLGKGKQVSKPMRWQITVFTAGVSPKTVKDIHTRKYGK